MDSTALWDLRSYVFDQHQDRPRARVVLNLGAGTLSGEGWLSVECSCTGAGT